MAGGGGVCVNPPHAAVVLAAGGSTRLGQPKQLLTRAGETLVHRATRLASETAPAQLLVVVGADGRLVAASVADMECAVVTNSGWACGLAGSLRTAGAHLDPAVRRVLVLLCDQPGLERHHLEALLEGAADAATGCAATRHDDALGVPAVVPRSWFDSLDQAGDRGFGYRLGQLHPADIFQLHAPGLGADIDSPQDLANARMMGWLDA